MYLTILIICIHSVLSSTLIQLKIDNDFKRAESTHKISNACSDYVKNITVSGMDVITLFSESANGINEKLGNVDLLEYVCKMRCGVYKCQCEYDMRKRRLDNKYKIESRESKESKESIEPIIIDDSVFGFDKLLKKPKRNLRKYLQELTNNREVHITSKVHSRRTLQHIKINWSYDVITYNEFHKDCSIFTTNQTFIDTLKNVYDSEFFISSGTSDIEIYDEDPDLRELPNVFSKVIDQFNLNGNSIIIREI
jgi:galactitol-specific phosphotransferase system IIB component